MKKGKVVNLDEAVRLIHDGDTVAVGGFVGAGFAEDIAIRIKETFLETGKPCELTLIYSPGMGDGKDRGLNHFAQEGLLKTVIGGHWGLAPKLQKLALENKIFAYNLPQGVLTQMYRDIASHKPRTITTVGMHTFVDPRKSGGKINSITKEDIVELVHFDGKEYLAYKTRPINVAIIRGTTADTDGNISMEREALTLDTLAIAMAAKNSDGFVIAQVERITEAGSINPRMVKIPGIFVDCIVVANPHNHWQTFASPYNPAFSHEVKMPMQSMPEMEMSDRKIIARRAAFELEGNCVINLGIGMPEGITNIAGEEKILEYVTLTAEPGIIGGLPSGGLSFGAGVNTAAVLDQPYQFDFYDGGGLDIAFLGLAQADQEGNLNVSKFGTKLAGAGGFINISQNARKLVFVGTFTAGGLEISVNDERLRIDKEGKVKKFIKSVEQITFSGAYAVQKCQPVLYVTERCVFKLTEKGLKLIEIAQGIDIEKDILANMDFVPIIDDTLQLMDKRIFQAGIMGIKEDLLSVPLAKRLFYDSLNNLFFVNFEGHTIKSQRDVDNIEKAVTDTLSGASRKVYTIVNYDNFNIVPDVIDSYTDMVKRLIDKFYIGVTRYTTSAFLRMKLGDSLSKRNVSPYIYESSQQARDALEELSKK
ncbi:MAG: acyl CoA:acetate/3-ketoacid CoA transferase [Desulfamplus sp.]|nr:acyl CoA:acetate/3-ketoacid CoA transferase [Desulfamplus sp.]